MFLHLFWQIVLVDYCLWHFTEIIDSLFFFDITVEGVFLFKSAYARLAQHWMFLVT